MYTLFGTRRAVPLLVGYLSFSVCTRLNYSFIYARRQHMQLSLILPQKKKSNNKNVLLLFRKVHCVVYLTENFVENSLVFCDLFGLCVYTCAHQFSSALQENLWENFLVTDFSLLLYVFFLIGNPGCLKNYMIFSLYERTLSCLVVGRWIRIKSDQHQLFFNYINTSSREKFNFVLQ